MKKIILFIFLNFNFMYSYDLINSISCNPWCYALSLVLGGLTYYIKKDQEDNCAKQEFTIDSFSGNVRDDAKKKAKVEELLVELRKSENNDKEKLFSKLYGGTPFKNSVAVGVSACVLFLNLFGTNINFKIQ